MALLPDQKFSTFQLGGNLQSGDILVGLRSGINTQFTWAVPPGVTSLTGTANEVLVNGSTGSPVIGAITLSLPQAIGTSNSPSFAGITLNGFAVTLGGALTTAGALTTSGAFGVTFTFTNTTNVTFPTSGTLATTAGASGIVNPGTINQLAYYAATGSAVSGLATGNNGVLVTSSGGVPSISTTLPNGISATSMILTAPEINQINDTNNNQILNFLPSPGTPVNYWQMANAQATFSPTMNVVGSDPNIAMSLNAKGSASIFLTNETNTVISIFSGLAGAVNYLTFQNNTTGNAPEIISFGSDPTVGMVFNTKGNGVYQFFGNNAFIATLTPVTSAVNYINIMNSITANAPSILAAGSDPNVGVYLIGKGTGAVVLANEGGLPILQAQGVASAVNNIQIENSITGNAPQINAAGSDSNISITYNAKGTGHHYFYGNSAIILELVPNASAVNNFNLQNASTGNAPSLNCEGSDPNINMVFNTKGTGAYYYYVDGLLSLNVIGQASAVNYISLQNSTTGFGPNIYASGSDPNVNLNLIPQGSGIVKANSGIVTVPHASTSASLSVGSAYQNTLGYDVVVTVYLSITAATNASILLGVGPTNTPTQQTILSSFSTTGLISIPIYIPAGYYALLSTSGTITETISGQITMAV